MKKSIILKSLVTLISIISLVSCETEPLDPNIDLTDFQDNNNPNNNATGSFTATVDDFSFVSSQTTGNYTNSTLGNELNLLGITTDGKMISLQMINPSVGTFQATTDSNGLLLFQYSDAALGSNGFFSSLNSSNNTSTGTITITEFNTTTNKISATFSFTAYGMLDSSVTKAVTQGVINNVSFDNQVTVNPGNDITGTYLMTAFNTTVPTDLNGDGTSSTNQMEETTCFNNNTIIIYANNTFTATAKGVDIVFDGANEVIECFTDPDFSGTWSQNGNNITFTYVDGGESYSDTYVLNGNTISLTYNDGEVVGTTDNGEPVYLTSDLTFIYTKQ